MFFRFNQSSGVARISCAGKNIFVAPPTKIAEFAAKIGRK